MGFVRSSDTALMARVGVSLPTPDSIEDTTTGPGAPNLEFVLTPMAWLDHACGAYPPGYHFGLHTVLLRYGGAVSGVSDMHSSSVADQQARERSGCTPRIHPIRHWLILSGLLVPLHVK